ncbi:hypothetical protein X943_000950 [Babesia divergens]|uniref:Transmembrane protein n=1 Tax=Babesia divergens TaxID=32595 RepID=A0AAD9GHM9_BABDI|nr:hypothetical protein X943_000950 [Babesia divergens]
MGWFIQRHAYYIRSEDFVAFLTLMHLLCMVLTGYGVLRHCSDLFEIQNNIWAICLAALSFLSNLCAIKGRDAFFKWFLPFTLLFSLTCFITLSAYHGIIMVFVVHLPLVSFVLTGMPCCLIFIICVVAITIGALFHTALISSLYSDFHGHMSLYFLQNVAAWLRYPGARGFNIIALDSYIIAVQVIIGVLCYQRFIKLGRLIGFYRARPACHLGSFDAIRTLEEEFLPPQSTCDVAYVNSVRRASAPMHHASQPSIDSSSTEDSFFGPFTDITREHSPGRFPLEHIEPYRFNTLSMRAAAGVSLDTESMLHPLASGNLDMEEISKHYKSKGESYSMTLFRSCNGEDFMDSSADVRSFSTVSMDPGFSKSFDATWITRGASAPRVSSESGLPPFRARGSKLRSGDYYSTQFSHINSIDNMDPMTMKSRSLSPPAAVSVSARPVLLPSSDSGRLGSALYTDRLLDAGRTSYISLDSNVGAVPTLRQDSPTSLKVQPFGAPPFNVENIGFNTESESLKIGSFEGLGHIRPSEDLIPDYGNCIDAHVRILAPGSFPTSGHISNSSRACSESNDTEILTSSTTLNAIIRLMPRCSSRLAMRIVKLWKRACDAREVLRHYTWSPPVAMPATNFMGVFVHTRVEAWYVDWMHEFNMNFYYSTVKETLMIFLMGLMSDALVLVRMYSTLERDSDIEKLFSPVRILILVLRYALYPIGVLSVLGHRLFKQVKRDIFYLYRSFLIICLVNMCLTFADMWSWMSVFQAGYSLHTSLYMCSMLTTTSLLMFTRIPTILCLYALSFIIYSVLLCCAGYGLGHNILEILCHLVVATGCLVFCVRPIDINRRNLFCSYTLPYLLYFEAMRH